MQLEMQYPLPKPMTLDLKKEDRVVMPDGVFRFVQGISRDRLLFHHEITGYEKVISERDVAEMFGNGKARRIPDPRRHNGQAKACSANPQISIDQYDTPEGIRARSLQFIVKEWDRDPNAKLGVKWIKGFQERMRPHAQRNGLTHEFSASRIIKAINDCGVPGDRQLRYFFSQRGKVKRDRLPAKIIALLAEAVSWFYSERRRTKKGACDHFRGLLIAENKEREARGLDPFRIPRRNTTVTERINSGATYDNWARKYSKWEADQTFRGVSNHISASRPGEIVIIDHTVVDGFVLIDEKTMLPLGRPYLSVAIDVNTRCIPGFIVTAEPPSIYTVTTLLKRVNRPKFYVAELYPDIEGSTDSYCHPLTVLCDNGWDLGSVSVVEALADIGTELLFAPIATPQYKAIGERAFHTFNTGLIHRLPGSIPYNLAQRRHLSAQKLDVDPHKDAIVTIALLERLIHEFIIVYENEPHSGVNGIPARLWQDALLVHPRRIIDDINALDHVLGRVTQGQLTKAGVKFKNMRFHDQENVSKLLNDLFGRQPIRTQAKSTMQSGRVKVKIKYNPSDASRIYIWHPLECQYYTLFNRDETYCEGLSFWAADQIYRFARAQDMEFKTDEQRTLARLRLQKTIEKLIPKKPLKASSEARRLLAQEVPTLEGKIVHAKASASVDGQKPAEQVPSQDIQIDVFGRGRIDGDAPIPGVVKNLKKQKQTRAATKKARENEPSEETASGPKAQEMFILPRKTSRPGFTPLKGDGWGVS